MTRYRDRRIAGYYDAGATPEATPDEEAETPLPGTHAKLDALAEERGHEWSDESLSVSAKQAELREAGA